MWFFFIKEHMRYVFRGNNFVPLETRIDRIAAPLFSDVTEDKRIRLLKKRLARAIGYLPPPRREKFYDMMARAGHAIARRED